MRMYHAGCITTHSRLEIAGSKVHLARQPTGYLGLEHCCKGPRNANGSLALGNHMAGPYAFPCGRRPPISGMRPFDDRKRGSSPNVHTSERCRSRRTAANPEAPIRVRRPMARRPAPPGLGPAKLSIAPRGNPRPLEGLTPSVPPIY